MMEHEASKGIRFGTLLLALICGLFALNLFFGSVHIPAAEVLTILKGDTPTNTAWQYIVLESRLPQALTALLAGAGLAASGLMLQTSFGNPLAGPSILGINTGASLGVALVMLLLGGSLTAGNFAIQGYLAIIVGAFAGSLGIMALLLFFSTLLKSNILLLITGIILSYITSSAISLLNYTSTAEGVQSYLFWGLGNFGGVSMHQMPFFAITSLIGIGMALMLIKPLNVLLLGTHYAENLGLNLKRVRNELLLATGLLTAVITAFCGPISFLGLAVPHIARLSLQTNNHRPLMPVTMLMGSALALLCNLLCMIPENTLIPLNAITPILGGPVILYVIFSRRYSA